MPYRIAGQVVHDGEMRLVLTKGDRVFEVRQGQTLEDGYRLESIAPHSVTFVYVPLALEQELPVPGIPLDLAPPSMVAVAGAPPRADVPESPPIQENAAPRTADLRFEGPREVHAGTPFDVALKVTSPTPVRAMPVQVTFDAKRLQPLSVRAGELFAGGRFAYRVNSNGSIFVGISGAQRAAADADLFVVTFRPIASGAAELRVSSVIVQGAAGRALACEAGSFGPATDPSLFGPMDLPSAHRCYFDATRKGAAHRPPF